LRANQVQFVENAKLVRGLDYYNNMVFEWITDELGAQGTVCAGGRYDGLVSQLGGRATPAVGLAFGMERLVLLLESSARLAESIRQPPDIYLMYSDDALLRQAILLAETLRREAPGLSVLCHCGGGKFNSQLKKAYNSGARLAVVVDPGADPDSPELRVRFLDDEGSTETVAFSHIVDRLRHLVAR